jgi:ABC-type antimicrobial peptide transport system permease subunit
VLMQVAAAVIVGLVAAWLPAWRTSRLRIIDGLRAIG